MQHRDYQLELNTNVIEELSRRRKVLMQLPTGGGKTVCFAKLCERFILKTGKSVLILVHREELMYQASKTIESMLDTKPYLITSKTNKHYIARVYIGMVESTVSRLNMFANVGMVIIDECHIANFNKIHSIFLEELIIGVTATPISSSKKEPLNKYYNTIVCGPQIKELIELGFLAQNITRTPKDIVDATQFQIDKLKGDYNEGQMAREYKLPKHVTNVVKNYFRFCFGQKTLIFNVNIEHSKEVAECFVACGHNARHLASDNNEEREATLKWFRETEDAILCNVMFFTFGFDEPTVRNIILNFSTLSLPKFIQCCGRGSRPINEMWIEQNQHRYPYPVGLKNHFNIIDMGGNCIRFGDWNDDRDWEYMFNHPPVPGEGIAPVKTCPQCEGLVHAASMVCTIPDENGNLCLYEFERKKTAIEQDMEEMVLITKGINVDELIGKNKKKYQYFTFLEMADPIVLDMFKRYGKTYSEATKQKYFKTYYAKCIEWYNKTLSGIDGNIEDITNSMWHIKRALNNFNTIIAKYNEKLDLYVTPIENVEITSYDKELFDENIKLHPLLINYQEDKEHKLNLEIQEGSLIEHSTLGRGKVVKMNTSFETPVATIKFDEFESEKQIIVKYAKMRLV